MVLTVLFILFMVFWALSELPFPQAELLGRAKGLFAFLAVLCLGLFIFVPGVR